MLTKKEHEIEVINARNALFLKERYELTSDNFTVDANLKNLDNWRKQKNLVSDESFRLKLEYEKYDKSKLNAVLNPFNSDVSPVVDTYIKNSEWFQVLNKSFELVTDINYADQELDWGVSVQNFLLWIKGHLQRIFNEGINHLEDKERLIKELLEHIGESLVAAVLKSAVLELQIAKLEGKLYGKTPEERFQSFIKIQFVNKEKAIEFYSEYIVLARLLTLKSIYFVNNIEDSFKSFLVDKKELQKEMGIDELIISIIPGRGDTHQKGKTVIEFKLQNKSVYYKPKNLVVATCYNDLINWINGKNHLLKMSTYKVIPKDEYSWEDQVEKKNCKNKKEAELFFERFGQITAIMHCLKGGDFHLENIIASGENPIIIDLETLFQQQIPLAFPDRAEIVAKNDYFESVMNTLLLPNRVYQDISDNKGIDMSALNGREQEMPIPVLGLDKPNTDEMLFKHLENLVILSDHSNLPVFEGEFVDYKNFKNNIYKGFVNTCKFFISYREELIHHPKLLKNFKNEPVRVILRPTQRYAQMLEESLHPDYLRDGLKREQILESMWGYLFKKKIVASHEINEMLVGDIPIFFNLPESCDIYDSNNQNIKNFFERPSYDLVVDRLNGLCEKEINKQLSWIKVSLKDYDISDPISYKNYTVNAGDIDNKERLIKEASDIGYRILNEAYYSTDESSISWLDLVIGKNKQYSIDPIPVDFYDGISGLTLLYYHLYKSTNDAVFKTVYNQLLYTLNQDDKIYEVCSPSTGSASILQMISRIPETNEQIENLLYKHTRYVKENIQTMKEIDYLSGLSGLINTFLHLYELKKDNQYLNLAISIGDQLILKLETEGLDGIGSGMAHGASGISYALFRLYKYSKNDLIYSFARLCLERDRQFFDKNKNAWIDEKNRYSHQWCHGSSGIGLSRVLIKEFYQDIFIDEEIEIAYKNILNQGYKSNDCLCHGNMGDIELFLTMNTKESRKSYIKLLNQILMDKESNNDFYINSLPGFDKKGLFTGIFGIAYQMLRVADPKNVPSVLY